MTHQTDKTSGPELDRFSENGWTDVQNIRPYLSIEQLAAVTPWTANAIRKMIARGVLKQGVHWFKPLGRRGLIFKWGAIVELIEQGPRVVREPDARRMPSPAGIDVEEATAELQRLLR